MKAIPVLETARLVLTVPPPSAAARCATYTVENEPHLAAWEPPRPEGYFTEEFWRRRLERNREELERDISVRFALFSKADPGGPVLGHCNLNQIVRGGFQACTVGYSIDHRRQGTGLMNEALRAVIEHAFGEMALHRMMANYIPTNERSGRLLRRLGFVVEGYARDYLYIGGAYRDHVLTSLTNTDATFPSG